MFAANQLNQMTQESNSHYLWCSFSMRGELDSIEINHPLFTAAVLIQGAQLISFQPKSDDDWIWLSEKVKYEKGVSVRGGIPVCWPWFGNLKDNPEDVQSFANTDNPPAHGFARTSDWQLDSIQETENQVKLILKLDASSHELWNGSAELRLAITMDAEHLCLDLTTDCFSDELTLSQALHTYFPTEDIHGTTLSGFEDSEYYDAMDGWQRQKQTQAISFIEETDRVYLTKHKPIHILETPAQTFQLETNTGSVVVWNPWIEKAKGLSQFSNNAWQKMFCVETANAMDDCVTLKKGQSHTLSMKLTSQS